MKAHTLTTRGLSCLVTAAAVLALAALTVTPGQAVAAFSPWSAVSAPGAPGATSYLDLGRKDCLGSATTHRSRVWFTVADGVLSDTYSPTTDNSNLSTLQFLVTDGHSFTDLQTRDMTYVARALDGTGMSCEIVATARSGRYRLVTDYLTDPARDSVVMHTRFEPLVPAARRYRVYVRYDAMINGAGGGGTTNGGANSATITSGSHRGANALVSYQTLARSSQTQRTYEVPVYGALAADHAYPMSSSGFAGTASDGLTQLDAQHRLGPTYRDADNGNVEQTAEIDPADERSFTLALGYGQTQASAVQAATASAATPFRSDGRALPRGLAALRRAAAPAPGGIPGADRRPGSRSAPAVLDVCQRAEGHRGQGVPGRRRLGARRPVGPGHRREHRDQRAPRCEHQLPGHLRTRLL